MDHAAVRAKIESALARFGVSHEGRAWLMRALHPAGDSHSPGLPDPSTQMVLRPEYRVQATIQSPEGASMWDCLMWSLPGDVNALWYATGPSPCDFSGPVQPPNATLGCIRLQDNVDGATGSYIRVGGGGGDPNPTTTFMTRIPASLAAASRHQYSSFTVHQIAAAINDQGQVYAAQFAPILRRNQMFSVPGFVSSPDNYPYCAASYTTVLPTNEVQMSAMAPGYYMGESREGVYVPLKLAGPAQPFGFAQWNGTLEILAGGNQYPLNPTATQQCGCAMQITSFVPQAVQPWPFSCMYAQGATLVPPIVTPSTLTFDTGFDNVNIGVALFRGLTGSANGFGAQLQVKTCNGLELIATPQAADRVYAEPPAPYEPRALEAYYALCIELPDAFPASFNSLSSILDAIGSVAKRIWSVVEKPLSIAANTAIPGIAGAGTSALIRRISGGTLTGARRGRGVAARGRKVQGVRGPGLARSRASSIASSSARPRLMGAGGSGVRASAPRLTFRSQR